MSDFQGTPLDIRDMDPSLKRITEAVSEMHYALDWFETESSALIIFHIYH